MEIAHNVFFVSDGTGLTAEKLGETLITQFPETEFKRTIFPYVKKKSDAKNVVDKIGVV